jgi:hypothetical protein
MGERDRTMNDAAMQWCEHEDLRHAYHRTLIEIALMQKRKRETEKTPVYFLEAEEDWTPLPMDGEFWRMVMGGLDGLRRYLSHT